MAAKMVIASMFIVACHVAIVGAQPSMLNANKLALESVRAAVAMSDNFPSIVCGGADSAFVCDKFGAVTKVSIVDVNLGGSIAGEIGSLTKLSVLYLKDTNLNGTIPFSIGRLTSLTELDLSSNSLNGIIPLSIVQLKSLSKLILSDNLLSGIIPTTINLLTKLNTLDLSSNALTGSIPSSIVNLKLLSKLILNKNQLSGPIPAKINLMVALTEMDLSENNLSGSIPSSIGLLKSLSRMIMSSNSLSGIIPSTIGQLKLNELDLSDNYLSGSIPLTIGQLKPLSRLALKNNRFSGSIPSTIGQLEFLAEMDLSSNDLSGSIPSSIVNLTFLSILFLTNNRLSGSIPSSIGQLKSLTEMDLSVNYLNGSIPLSIDQLTSLSRLILSNNRLSGSIPSSIGQLESLIEINLSNNTLTDVIPSSIENLVDLLILDLHTNQLSGNIPSVDQLTSLETLDLSENLLSGSIPQSIGNLSSAFAIVLYTNQLSGSIPSIVNLTSLEYLDIHGNQLSDIIPSSIGELTALSYVDLSSNQLSGIIPSSIGQLTSLGQLYLNDNLLSGEIPSSIFAIGESLGLLNISSNQLTGSIPSSIENLTSLYYLSLKANFLSGNIPSTIGSMSELSFLDLSFNQLVGPIPLSIGDLPYLYELYLQKNMLSGKIPSSIGQLASIGFLDLSFNSLSGTIPSSIDQLGSLRVLNLNNNLLIGQLLFQLDVWQITPIFNLTNNFLSGSAIVYQDIPNVCAAIRRNCFKIDHPLLKSCSLKDQRTTSECSQFCDASQALGACSGRGICPGYNTPCICDPDYSSIGGSPYACTFSFRGLGLTSPPQNLSSKVNQFFRYASSGFLYSLDKTPTWLVATSWNWIAQLPSAAVKDQQNCRTCWVFSAFSSIEYAYYIANGGTLGLPDIPPEQLSDCSNIPCSTGGWPSDAFDYAAVNGLLFSYGGTYSCNLDPDSVDLKILSYDRVKMSGWTGLLLALQQQPSVVAIEASSDAFINYNPNLGVFADESCFSNGVDHSVLVVGYDLTAETPYWLIQNSWGSSWGENGFMRIKITNGFGICGINTQPAIIPILNTKLEDPCNSRNLAQVQQNASSGPGNMNPCGNGICYPGDGTYSCNCMPGFVAVTNTDETATCAPVSPCTFSSINPCRMGTCVDSVETPGSYSCLCLMGYVLDESESSLTCVPAGSSDGPASYIVPVGGAISCPQIYNTYGLSKKTFTEQNKDLDCTYPLEKDTKVDVTNARNCSIVYSINPGDTCDSIKYMFGLSDFPELMPTQDSDNPDVSLNPGMGCGELEPFQQICVKRGNPPYHGPCTLPYNVNRGETCATIIRRRMKGNATKFYSLNPGVYCGTLQSYAKTDSNFKQEVCLERVDLEAASAACNAKIGKSVILRNGDTCSSITRDYFKKKSPPAPSFKLLNTYACTSAVLRSILSKSKKICVQK